MVQKIVLVEAFNDNVFDFRNTKSQIDMDAVMHMTTFAKTNPNRIGCKIEFAADLFSIEMPRDDFLKVIDFDNVSPALKSAFEAADQIDKSQINAGPQAVAGTNQWHVSIISP